MIDKPNQIYSLLPKVMADIGNISKEGRNNQQNYNFRGIDQALNAIGPVLQKHGVSVSVSVENHQHELITVHLGDRERTDSRVTLLLVVRFYAPDGSYIENKTAGEGWDAGGDKATNKAMSAAMKYALFFGLVIPVNADDIVDHDRDGKEESRPLNPNPPPRAKAKPAEPNPIADLKQLLHKQCDAKVRAEAELIVAWVTDGVIKYEDAASNPSAAETTLKALQVASKTTPYKNMIEKATQEIAANEVL
jgi:hypothetical protein